MISMKPTVYLRTCGLALGVFLALYSVWFLGAEIARPHLTPESRFPPAIPKTNIDSVRSAASLAATLGIIRGDLWAEGVLVDATKILGQRVSLDDAMPQKQAEKIRVMAERAVANAPLLSPIWFILATLRYDANQKKLASEQLKMSYYTGPNDTVTMSHRLGLFASFQTIEDPDLRNVVRREIRTILLRAPELRRVVINAHRDARPEPRRFIEAAVSEVDPSFLATLRRGVPR